MRKHGHIRVFVAASLLVVTFGGTAGIGSWMAAGQQQQDVQAAASALDRSHQAFQKQVALSLADGVAADQLAELVGREKAMMGEPAPHASFFVDRRVAAAIDHRSADIARMTEDVVLNQDDAELAMWRQLGDATLAMQQDLIQARDLGIDTNAYDAFLLTSTMNARRPQVPNVAQKALQALAAQDASLKQAIAQKTASNSALAAAAAALQAARDGATYQQQRAAGDLARAQATNVLDVHEAVASIAALDQRFPAAVTTDDFNSLAGGYAAQARVLENLLYTRSAGYSMLGQARALYDKAKSLGADLAGVDSRLADLSSRLDRATNLADLQNVSGLLSMLIRDLNGAIFDARTRPYQPPGAIIANVPFFKQIHSLSCEAASLQMALGKYNISANQGDILNTMGMDTRAPVFDSSGTLHWGNPYISFVGNVDGYENATSGSMSGYGVYWTPIAAAATHFGAHVAQAGEGIAPATIYNAAHNQQPAVVWVAYAYQPQPIKQMVTWDGRTVMYGAPVEHAVTVAGWVPGYVLLNNPHSHPEWIDTGTFERAYAMFNDMAVILQP